MNGRVLLVSVASLAATMAIGSCTNCRMHRDHFEGRRRSGGWGSHNGVGVVRHRFAAGYNSARLPVYGANAGRQAGNELESEVRNCWSRCARQRHHRGRDEREGAHRRVVLPSRFCIVSEVRSVESGGNDGADRRGAVSLSTCATAAEARTAIAKVRVVAVVEPARGFPCRYTTS